MSGDVLKSLICYAELELFKEVNVEVFIYFSGF